MIEQLSSASLLLTVVTVLYSLWYSEIKNAKEIESRSDKRNNTPKINKVKETIKYKSGPISILSIILSVILLPDTISIILNSSRIYLENPLYIFEYYDSVSTTFCFIQFGLIAFSIQFVVDLIKLRKKKRELTPE